MSKRRKQSNKPIFKKKSGIPSAVKNIILILILVGVGFLIGKIGVGLLAKPGPDNEVKTPAESEQTEATSNSEVTSQSTTTPPPESEFEDTEPVIEPDVIYNGILRVDLSESDDVSEKISSSVEYAKQNNYKGVCVELLENGGKLYFATSNEKAVNAEAVSKNAVSLNEISQEITSNGLLAYAEISSLSDHIVSWYDKSCAYEFEDGSSRWLDNKLSNGGKPWLSPFSNSAKEYICELVSEISDAGFAGIFATDLSFPPFRNSDLNYIGDSVKNPERYIALCDFANSIQDTLGLAKEFGISVSAKEVILSKAEVLSDPTLLKTKKIYVRYDSSEIGEKLLKEDGTAVSFAGLSEYHKVKTVFKNVLSSLSEYDVTVIPEIVTDSPDELLKALEEMGFDRTETVVIKK